MADTKTGYVNGSDMLLYVGGVAIGHCSTHKMTCTSETKERAVKPVASEGISSGKWKEKSIVGLSITLSAEGFGFYDETECGYRELLALWKEGAAVTAKCMERDSTDPYLVGSFVITSLERTDAAQDDTTYSVELENNGEPDTLDETAITNTTSTSE